MLKTLLLLAAVALPALVRAQGYDNGDGTYEQFDYAHGDRWVLTGRNGYLTGGWGDPFCYSGCSVPVQATMVLDVDAETNRGKVVVEFDHDEVDVTNEFGYNLLGLSGSFKLVFETFVQMSPMNKFMEGGVANNVLLHGNNVPVVPKVHAFLAMWGPGKMYHDGADLFPGENMIGHSMLTQRVYDSDMKVYKNCTTRGTDGADSYWSLEVGDNDPNNVEGCLETRDSHVKPEEMQVNFRSGGSLGLSSVNPLNDPVWIHLVFHDITDNSPTGSDTPKLSAGAIAAIVIGSLAVVALMVAGVFYSTRSPAAAGSKA